MSKRFIALAVIGMLAVAYVTALSVDYVMWGGFFRPMIRLCDAHAQLAAEGSPMWARGVDAYKVAGLNTGDGLNVPDKELLRRLDELPARKRARCGELRAWLVRPK